MSVDVHPWLETHSYDFAIVPEMFMLPSMAITYCSDRSISEAEFIDVLRRSTLAERRPVNDASCIQAMLRHADLLCTAWDGVVLIGVARSVTDFEYCCYLSDLAVDVAYQKSGVGRQLIAVTRSRLGPKANLILLAAPAAEAYYPKIGFDSHRSAWILTPGKPLTGTRNPSTNR